MTNEAQNQRVINKEYLNTREKTLNNLQQDLKKLLNDIAKSKVNDSDDQQLFDGSIFNAVGESTDEKNKLVNINSIEMKEDEQDVQYFNKIEKYLMFLHNLLEYINGNLNIYQLGPPLSTSLKNELVNNLVRGKIKGSYPNEKEMAKAANQEFCQYIRSIINGEDNHASSMPEQGNQMGEQFDSVNLKMISEFIGHYQSAIEHINVDKILSKMDAFFGSVYWGLRQFAPLPKDKKLFDARVRALHGQMPKIMDTVSQTIHDHVAQTKADTNDDPLTNTDSQTEERQTSQTNVGTFKKQEVDRSSTLETTESSDENQSSCNGSGQGDNQLASSNNTGKDEDTAADHSSQAEVANETNTYDDPLTSTSQPEERQTSQSNVETSQKQTTEGDESQIQETTIDPSDENQISFNESSQDGDQSDSSNNTNEDDDKAAENNLQTNIDKLNEQIKAFNDQCQNINNDMQQRLANIDQEQQGQIQAFVNIKNSVLGVIDAGKDRKKKKQRTNEALNQIKSSACALGVNEYDRLDNIQAAYNKRHTKRNNNHQQLLELLGTVLDNDQLKQFELDNKHDNKRQQIEQSFDNMIANKKTELENQEKQQASDKKKEAYQQSLQPALDKFEQSIEAYDSVELGRAYTACQNKSITEVAESEYREKATELSSRLVQAEKRSTIQAELDDVAKLAKVTSCSKDTRQQGQKTTKNLEGAVSWVNNTSQRDIVENFEGDDPNEQLTSESQPMTQQGGGSPSNKPQPQPTSALSKVVNVLSAPFRAVLGVLNGIRYGLFKHDQDCENNSKVDESKGYSGFKGRFQYGFFQAWNSEAASSYNYNIT